ncbi:MAG: hypothetical protein GOMPHAMPRED_008336 [Gomphillus americanus]|uniref:Uncharacterized protein n=1 Tax=Gomphillus americanus TaxID=1940652 RepID=A0A8H3IGJ9_9LECA|nr:MAG: hypothetical protein GOMPHAMPRED_008336 [Gomphillus americanus]
MAFRQSVLPSLSRRYSNPQQLSDNDILSSPTRAQQGHYEPQLGPISDFGSLNTIPQSGGEDLSDIVEDVIDDLDSLDDGLQEFRDTSAYRTSDLHNGPILPAHDGLGSFHPAKTQFEQDSTPYTERITPQSDLNRPIPRLDDLHNEQWDEEGLERSLHDRVEQWRLEQSKIVLEEIEKERRKAEAKQRLQESLLARNQVATSDVLSDPKSLEETSGESIWQQLARHVMKDLIGVDDVVLSAIFGEDLIPEEELSKTPTPDVYISRSAIDEPEESGMWNRLIKELRQLAQGLSSDTLMTKEQLAGQLDYAGIPVSWLEDRLTRSNPPELSVSAQFKPTLPSTSMPLPLGSQLEGSTAEQEYWEQVPNLKTVISYLYQRFGSSPTTNKQHTTSSTQKAQEALQRAAIIQQCHPLISRNHHHYYHTRNKKHPRQSSSSYRAGSLTSGMPHFTSLKRRSSSCASWSTKRSRRGESNASRNYWDLGESTGSGSLVFAGVGAWGEV